MRTRIWKEIRSVLPLWVVALGLAVFAGMSFGPEGLLIYVAGFLYWLVFVGLAVSIFGLELSQRTFGLMLAQPVSRTRLWMEKTAAGALGFLVLTLVFLLVFWFTEGRVVWLLERLSPGGYNAVIEHEALMRQAGGSLSPGYGAVDWRPFVLANGFVGPLCAFGGGIGFTLLLRHVHGAFWLAALVPGALFTLGSVVIQRIVPELGSTAPLFLLAIYGIAGYVAGLICFLRMESTDGGEDEKSLDAESWLVPFPMRSSSGWSALLKKELLLHQVNWILVFTVVLILVVSVLIKPYVGGFDFDLVAGFLFFLIIGVLPLMIAAPAISEERKLGTIDWHHAVPFSLERQWLLKLAVSAGAAALISYFLIALFSRALFATFVVGPETTYAWLVVWLLPAVAAVVGFWASSLAGNLLHALAVAAAFFLGVSVLFAGAVFVIGSVPPVSPVRLVGLFMAPLMGAAALWLSWRNFKWRPNARLNLAVLAGCYVLSVVSAAALYHRSWEYLGPAMERTDAPAVAPKAMPRIATGLGTMTAVLAPDGTLWEVPLLREHSRRGLRLERVSEQGGFSAVAVGSSHGVALRNDGSLWSWGRGYVPALGVERLRGVNPRQPHPLQQVGDDTDWTAVAAGASHTLALKSDGSLWGWGWSLHGVLGAEHMTNPVVTTPVRLGTERWLSVAADVLANAGIRDDGTLWRWGGGRAESWRVGTMTNLGAVYLGRDYIGAVDRDGAWWIAPLFRPGLANELSPGPEIGGPLANGPPLDFVSSRPVALAIAWDGSLWEWRARHLRSRHHSLLTQPARVGRRHDWMAIGLGGPGERQLALTTDGWLWAWGGGEHYLTEGERLRRLLPYPRKPQRVVNLLTGETD